MRKVCNIKVRQKKKKRPFYSVSTGTVLMLIKRKALFNKKREKPFESPTISVVWDIISSEANK